MSIGKKIKQLRELRNLTQAYMANELNMSLGGYGKIERDETDITISRLNQIAEILETDLSTILNFDSNQVFNLYNNKVANANGVVQNQQIVGDSELKDLFSNINTELNSLRTEINNLKKQATN